MKQSYFHKWLHDAREIALHELRNIFRDGGVLLIFFVAGLAYPLLYNVIYSNGILEDSPIAVVDEAACSESRRYIREMDATREVRVAYRCVNMAEAEKLMQERKVNGIVLLPRDFGEKLARMETATLSLYCDMSSFLYYKNAMMAANHVMLEELGHIQLERYAAAGFTDTEAAQLVQPVPYEENNPYNSAFSYSIFLLSAILLIIIQQTMFYGMSLLAGTMREQNRSFASLPDRFHGHGVGRIVLGRGAAYWFLYMGIGMYIAFIVPAIFGLPQRGNFWDILLLLLFFVTDCVFFSMTWSTVVTKRETVFVLFLFMSPICLFLTGTSWPTAAIPGFWKTFSYLFPSTFGVQAFINMNTAGGDLATAHDQMIALTIQTALYFALSMAAVSLENWVLRNKERIREESARRIEERFGIDLRDAYEENKRIITGE